MKTIIRNGRIVDKSLKGKGEIPTIVVKGFNDGEKWSIPVNSGDDIDQDFTLGEEVRVEIKSIPMGTLNGVSPVLAVTVENTLPIEQTKCSLAVAEEDMGKVSVCQGCPNLEEKIVDNVADTFCKIAKKPEQPAAPTSATPEPQPEQPAESSAEISS